MKDFLHMGGYGFYVWSSYGMLAAALLIELVGLHRRRRGAWQRFDELRAEYGEPAEPMR
ncbi:MAG: heme exporter protein CcmD [Burkholderiaceae bacterium]